MSLINDGRINLLSQGLGGLARRQQAIAGNITNVDTPRYQRRASAAESRPADARTGEPPPKPEDRTAALLAIAVGPVPLLLQSLASAPLYGMEGGAAGRMNSVANQAATGTATPGAPVAAGAVGVPNATTTNAGRVPPVGDRDTSLAGLPPVPGASGQSGSVASNAPPEKTVTTPPSASDSAPPAKTADAPSDRSASATTITPATLDAGRSAGRMTVVTPSGVLAAPSGNDAASVPPLPTSTPTPTVTRPLAELGELRLPDPPQPPPPAPSDARVSAPLTAATAAPPVNTPPSVADETTGLTANVAPVPEASARGFADANAVTTSSDAPVDDTDADTEGGADSAGATAALTSGPSATPSDGTAVIAPARSIDQVADGLTLTIRAGKTEATLSLRPASLGEVKVQISSGADGLIIRIAAERDAVSELLRSRVGELRDVLGGRQIAVSEVHVLPNPPALTGHAQDAAPQQRHTQTAREDDASADQRSRRYRRSEPDDESQ